MAFFLPPSFNRSTLWIMPVRELRIAERHGGQPALLSRFYLIETRPFLCSDHLFFSRVFRVVSFDDFWLPTPGQGRISRARYPPGARVTPKDAGQQDVSGDQNSASTHPSCQSCSTFTRSTFFPRPSRTKFFVSA